MKLWCVLLLGLSSIFPLYSGPLQTLNSIADYSGESFLPFACYVVGGACGTEVALKWTDKRQEKDFFQNVPALLANGAINYLGILTCWLIKPTSYSQHRWAGFLVPITLYALMSACTKPNPLDPSKPPHGALYGVYVGIGGVAGAILASSLAKLFLVARSV
jgi:hypothetical protein